MTPWTVARRAPLSTGFSRREDWSGLPFPSPGDLPDPGAESQSPALQADSLPAEPPGKPKNTGVGSLALLQGIFLTQESNQCFLHYRQILYQLSYQGSPVQFSSVAQSCPTLCDPMNRSPPGLPVHHQLPGTVQSRDQHKSRNCPRSHRKFLSQTRAEAGVLSTTSLSTCS